MRQPTARPMARPSGRPKIIAMEVPVATIEIASGPWLSSTRRVAMTAATDQKIAWAEATTRRARTRMGKLGAAAERN